MKTSDVPARIKVIKHVSFGKYNFIREPDVTNCKRK